MPFDAETGVEGGSRNPLIGHDGHRTGNVSFTPVDHLGNSPYRSPPYRTLELHGHFNSCKESPFGKKGLDGNGERRIGQ